MNADKIQSSVDAINDTNRVLNEFHAKFVEAFKPLVGESVLKAYGRMNVAAEAIFKHVLKAYPGPRRFSVIDAGYHTALRFVVNVVRGEGSARVYRSEGSTFGVVKDHILTELIPSPSLKTDYTVEEFASWYSNAKTVLDAAEDAVVAARTEFHKYNLSYYGDDSDER